MKHLIFCLALALLCTETLIGQSCTGDISYDYSSAQAWNTEEVIGTAYSPPISNPDVNFTGGQLNIFTGNEEYVGRAYRNLGTTLCNSFIAELEFTSNNTGSGREIGEIPLALTEGNFHPNGLKNTGQTTYTDPSEGQIFVTYSTVRGGPNNGDFRFRVIMWDNGTRTLSPILDNNITSNLLTANTTYDIRLERIEGNRGRLTVINQSNNQEGSICFTVPSGIGNLNTIQHSGNPRGGDPRVADFSVDNLCITNCSVLDDCCFVSDFQGPTLVCGNSATYTFPGTADSKITWTVTSPGSFDGNTGNSFEVFFPSAGTYIITATIECGCETILISKTVTVTGIADAGFTANFTAQSGTGQTGYVTISFGANSTGTGINHEWRLYVVPCTTTVSNWNNSNFTPSVTGTGSSYTVPNPGSFNKSDCHLVEHILSFDNGCPDVVEIYIDEGGESESNGANSEAQIHYDIGSNLNIYPNPSQGELRINSIEAMQKIQILDAAGKILLDIDAEGRKSLELDLSELSPGTLLVQTLFENGTEEIQTLLIE